ncbi:MAG: 3'(2'),5'-bisphosphate nucleotidase CysQ [Alphaproteobacteria bacterium]|jgi:3'(2'), 5'-bisphosphate nucleotidase|nr:3'(2'),5'-bisphosphate nucleotidase CysQ [Alphaproteobacteria bacterium]
MIAPALLLPKIVALVDEAAAVVMEHYRGDPTVAEKADASPVTAADEAAERVLAEGLRALTPEVPVVAEEERARGASPEPDAVGELFWLVDPLDGTKEFIKKNGEFTLNVGLIQAGRPILGVVAAPAVDALWTGAAGHGASLRTAGEARAIAARGVPASGPVAMVSRSHGTPEEEELLAAEGTAERRKAGSSLKFCRIAEGMADIYPRFGRTMEWDTAAAHAVLAAAGGRVTTRAGAPLVYGKPDFANDAGFVARGRAG